MSHFRMRLDVLDGGAARRGRAQAGTQLRITLTISAAPAT
jgi:hypothetical protein